MSARIPENYNKLVEVFNGIPRVDGLKLENFNEKVPENPADFLYLFFTNWSNKYNTGLFVGEKSVKIVTATGKNRSLNETFDIIRNYYENYDIKKYFQNIYEFFARLNIENKKKAAGTQTAQASDFNKLSGLSYIFNCSDINRTVVGKFFFTTESFHSYTEPKNIFPYYFVFLGYAKHATQGIPYYLYDESVCEYLLGDKYKK